LINQGQKYYTQRKSLAVPSYKILTDLIPLLEQYQNEGQLDDVHAFAEWINNKSIPPPSEKPLEKLVDLEMHGTLEAQICQYISLMYKYLRLYFKKGLNGSELKTTDDFGFLTTLVLLGDMKKNELIQKNTCEFTSGMEVIRRLERHELIRSYRDLEDKRARRVMATEKGHRVFIQLMPMLEKIGSVAVGDLTELEKRQILKLLSKLKDFHHPIFHKEKLSSIAQIFEKYINDGR
jgi:DNA-binding PadR family transcriptional regulator